MKQTEVCDALVLGANKYDEDSAVVVLSGKHGVFSLIARGIYKPKSALKPLLISGSLVRVEYRLNGKAPGTASSLIVLEDASSLYMDYGKSIFLLFLKEITASLFRYGDIFPHDEIHTILKKLKDDGDLLSLSLLTIGTIYKRFGIDIETKHCVKCGETKHIVAYSLSDGGILCQDCADEISIHRCTEMDIFVLIYSFRSLSQEILNKKVPKDSGIRVLTSLIQNLISYFDLKPLNTLSLLIKVFNEEN